MFGERLRHAWNAFLNLDERYPRFDIGAEYSYQPDRYRTIGSNERSIIASIYTRICVDVSMIDIRHVRMDEENRYKEDVESGLNNCLTVEANLDQSAKPFIRDVVRTALNMGVAAIVPVDTTVNPDISASFDIKTLRVGEVVAWYPEHVRVELYNQKTGRREQILLAKEHVGIFVNPFYDVMNEPNSTLRRIIDKLNLLDAVDNQSSSGKLDMIIQLPYVIKSEAKREQAEQRRKDIEKQLKGSQYGIAYTDGTEKITQLNRPAENNLLKQIEYLMTMLYGQLGLTEEVMNGTADEKAMLNYQNRTIKPIIQTLIEEMRRKFITKTARTQKQTLMAFRNPFELVPIEDFAEIADKMTRNEILTSNEMRQFIGIKPSGDPKADELRNSNMPQPEPEAGGGDVAQSALADVNATLDSLLQELGAGTSAGP